MSDAPERPKRGRNFYGPGPYVEREVDDDLLEALRAGEYALVFGARGSGKTSLRIRTSARLANEGFRVATVDLGAIGAESRPDAFYASLVIEAGRSVGRGDEAKLAWRRSKGPVSMRLRACLREILLEPEDAPLCLFIDELELVRALGPARDDFFTALRAMADARGHDPIWERLRVCLVGAVTRDELISDPNRAGFDVSAREFVPRDFTREQLGEFAETLAPLEVDTKALLDALHDWTSGAPALVQWLCGDLLLREIDRGSEATAVEAVVRETFLQRGPEVDPLLGETARRLRRDRRDPYRSRVLAAYERILRGETIDLRGRQLGSEGALIVARLKVAGLAAASAGAKLRVRNRIVERAFDRNWVRRALAGRPVSDALERWEASGRRAGQLLRGEALQSAIEWVEGRPDVTPSERDFVLASTRARSRRLRGLLYAGAALSLGLGATLGFVSWQYQDLATRPGPSVVAEPAPQVEPDPNPDASTDAREVEPAAAADDEPTSAFMVAARDALEQASLPAELRAELETLDAELSALELRLALERASRAELLAEDPTRRSEGLELTLGALSAWIESDASIDDAPAPITRGLTASLPSPGDTTLLAAHPTALEQLRFNADGSHFVSWTADGLSVWHRHDSRRLAHLPALASVSLAALSPNGRQLAVLREGELLSVWTLVDDELQPGPFEGPPRQPMGAPTPLAPIAELGIDDGGHVTLIRRDGSLDTVDPKAEHASARLRHSALPPELELTRALVVSPDVGADTRVVVVREPQDQVELWRVSDGQLDASVTVPEPGLGAPVTALRATPDASQILILTEGAHSVLAWDPSEPTLREIAVQDQPIAALEVSPSGELLATTGDDRRARLWSIDDGSLVASVDDHDERPTTLAFAPDGSALVLGDRNGEIEIHDIELGVEASLPIRAAALGPRDIAATIHYDSEALELRWAGARARARWPIEGAIEAAVPSVDGHMLLQRPDHVLVLLSSASGPSGEPLARFEGVSAAVMSPDGKLSAIASERQIQLLDGEGGRIATLSGHEAAIQSLALSPDASRLISLDEARGVRVWDAQIASILATFEAAHAEPWGTEHPSASLAINGDWFVLVDRLGGAQLWSMRARSAIAELELGGDITSIALSPGGEWIALGRGDGDRGGVELWHPSSLEPVARFRAVGPITALRISDDDEILLAVDGHGRLAQWPLRSSAWISAGCLALPPGSVLPGVCLSEKSSN